ncbi:hypothetical protein DB31_5725 [Hyalangium minutum]|uniref:Outer membrane protein beta-barrel domain-containing protein n=1 Tax=Hyalangium minutum TaxID=394096 RepID=A0A085WSM0_9BACT|nr:hypothetical protein DB31_5725 [Hyalangium minutum]
MILLLAVPTVARAQSYEEHRAVSLLAGPGLGYTTTLSGDRAVTGPGVLFDVGGSLTVGYDQDEVFLLARAGLGEAGKGGVLLGGFRSIFGREEWQTFFDVGAAVRLFSGTWAGPRLGFGVRRTLSDQLSFYGGLGLSLGFGSGMRVDAEAFTGLQWSFPIGSR